MKPEQQAEILIEDFMDIVKDLEMARECAIYFVEKAIKLDEFAKDWWKEVMKCVKQY